MGYVINLSIKEHWKIFKKKVLVFLWKSWLVSWSLLRVFWLMTNVFMESAMFDFQSWAPNGPNVANFVTWFLIRQVRSFLRYIGTFQFYRRMNFFSKTDQDFNFLLKISALKKNGSTFTTLKSLMKARAFNDLMQRFNKLWVILINKLSGLQ